MFSMKEGFHLDTIPVLLSILLFTLIIEALVLYKSGFHKILACLVFASLANFSSLISCILFMLLLMALPVDEINPVVIVCSLIALVLLVEFFVLKACSKNFSAARLVLPVLLMNALTLIPAYFILA